MINNAKRCEYYSQDIKIKDMMKNLTGDNITQKIDIPEHQRNYVWNDSDATDLLKSLIYGYPISAITANKNEENNTIELQDGLQRNFSIRRIYLQGYKFIDKEILKSFFPTKNFDDEKIKLHKNELKKIIEDEEISISNINKKILEINSSYYFELKENDDKVDSEKKYKNFDIEIHDSIKGVVSWITNDKLSKEEMETDRGVKTMLSIKIPHIFLKSFKNKDDIANVFTLVNSKGKRLSSFEKTAAEWAKTPINISSNSNPISTFHAKRKNKYYNEIDVKEEKNPFLVKYNDLKVIPSNFILSIISNSLGNTIISDTFLDEFGNLKINSEEAAIELVKYSYKKNIANSSKVDLGKNLSSITLSPIDVENQIKKILNSYNLVTNHMKILKYAKGNKKSSYSLDIKGWFITVFIITAMKNPTSDLSNFDDWFLYEFLYGENFYSGTRDYAKEAISKNFYLGKIYDFSKKHNSKSSLKTLMNGSLKLEKIIYSKKEITSFAKLILGLIQGKDLPYQTDVNLEIDHFIPQKTFSQFDSSQLNKNSLFNLNLLSSDDNSRKRDYLTSENLKDDFVYKWLTKKWNQGNTSINEEDVKQYEDSFNEMLFNSYHYKVYETDSKEIDLIKENGKFVKHKKDTRNKEKLIEFIEIREMHMKEIIKELFVEWF